MCNCEFCHTQFYPRPQVKCPRACPACQLQRQRDNEKDWRNRNPRYSDPSYHRVCRRERIRVLRERACALVKCLKIGGDMTGVALAIDFLTADLVEFVIGLGIRRVNKFWPQETAA
jgi:hypothetical protein